MAHRVSPQAVADLDDIWYYVAKESSVSTKKASAQDPTKLAPENYKVLLENSQLRAIDYRLKPGEKEPMHSHPCGVFVYYFSEAKISLSSS
jgi:hypothetical protein